VYQPVSFCGCACLPDVMFELTQTEKPNHDTHTHTHPWGVWMHTWVCVFKIIRYVLQTWAGGWDVCVCVFLAELQFVFRILGKKTARQESTINMLIYAATSSFHYAYNYHWSRVCSPSFLMYESFSCGEQGQNQQSHVDLCSSWFPASIIHQGGTLTPSTG